jgi:uncharacterized protein YjbI with pentapeptide repeats
MMPEDPSPPKPFRSLYELRGANDVLLKSQSDATPNAPQNARSLSAAPISDFIDRAAATGSVLDAPADRRAAQGLIDYWVASSYSLPRDRSIEQSKSRRANVLLREFESETIIPAVRQGTAYVEELENNQEDRGLWSLRGLIHRFFHFEQSDQDTVRRIMLRLIRLSDRTGACVSSPASREQLTALGDTQQVNRIIDALERADILNVAPADTGDVVALRYDALISEWPWLKELIDERMTYRERALNWALTGRREGRLLTWWRIKKFREFGNLDELEQGYVNASGNFASWRVAVIGGLFFYSVTVMAGLYYFSDVTTFYRYLFVSTKKVDQTTDSIIQRITNGNGSPEAIAEDIRWLGRNGKTIDIPSVKLRDMDLQELFAPGANFGSANLENVKFNSAVLIGSSFRKSTIDQVEFQHAVLQKVGFDSATISKANFSNANLVRASFDGAQICAGADFSNADVRQTSVRGITFTPELIQKFSGTAWWLMNGLSMDEIYKFNDTFLKDDPKGRAELPGFRKDFDEAQKKLVSLKDEYNQASWMNEKAWTLAIYGADSPGGDMDGVTLAEESIKKLDGLIDAGNTSQDYRKVKATVTDTLAYVLMQRAAKVDVKREIAAKDENLKRAIDLLSKDSINLIDDGGIFFRYAVALAAVGRTADAVGYLTKLQQDRTYVPTHELYLLNNLIKSSDPEFQKKLRDLIGSQPLPAKPQGPNSSQQSNIEISPCAKVNPPPKDR